MSQLPESTAPHPKPRCDNAGPFELPLQILLLSVVPVAGFMVQSITECCTDLS